jgi:hypothetical protein
MEVDKSMKNGIIASIIGAIIFLVILEPLMKFFWAFLNRTTLSLYTSYLNSIFREVARDFTAKLDFGIYLFIIFAMVAFCIYAFMQTRDIVKRNEPKKKFEGMSRDEIFKKRIVERNKFYKRLKINYKIMIILIIILCLGSLDIIFRESTCVRLNQEFKQNTNIISPYIDENEQKVLVSKWVSIQDILTPHSG